LVSGLAYGLDSLQFACLLLGLEVVAKPHCLLAAFIITEIPGDG